jgi:hypothetical protein
MNVVLTNRAKTYSARGTYDPSTKALIVKAGAKVSADIAYSPTFRGSKTIEKLRAQFVVNGITKADVPFKSPSTAANFVTGRSSNGMILWKTEDGAPLKNAISG